MRRPVTQKAPGAPDLAAMAGSALSGPLWPYERRSHGRGSRRRRVAAIAMALTGVSLVHPVAAEDAPTPRLGMPGFARGFEGFFDDGGYRTPDDEAARPTTLRSARQEWTCRLYEDLADFTLTEGPITLNNVSLRSGINILSGKRSGELTFSLVNRSREAQHTTVQVIVYDTTSPLPALAFSAEPLMGVIDAQTTEQLSASLNTRPGELDSLARFCVRLDGGW